MSLLERFNSLKAAHHPPPTAQSGLRCLASNTPLIPSPLSTELRQHKGSVVLPLKGEQSDRVEGDRVGRGAPAKGGAHLESGRTALAPELVRHHRVCVSLNDGQHADLDRIAEAWEQPPATAAYAFVARFLSQARDQCLKGGQDVTLAIGASIVLLRASGYIITRQRSDAPPDG